MSHLKSKTFLWSVVPCVVIVSGLAQSSSLKNILSPWLCRRRWKHSVWLMRSSYIYLLQCVFDWFWHTHSTLGFIRKPSTGTTEPHILPSNGCILTHTHMYHSMCVYVCFFLRLLNLSATDWLHIFFSGICIKFKIQVLLVLEEVKKDVLEKECCQVFII